MLRQCKRREKIQPTKQQQKASHNLRGNFWRGPSYPWTVESSTSAKLRKYQQIIKPFMSLRFFNTGTSHLNSTTAMEACSLQSATVTTVPSSLSHGFKDKPFLRGQVLKISNSKRYPNVRKLGFLRTKAQASGMQ